MDRGKGIAMRRPRSSQPDVVMYSIDRPIPSGLQQCLSGHHVPALDPPCRPQSPLSRRARSIRRSGINQIKATNAYNPPTIAGCRKADGIATA